MSTPEGLNLARVLARKAEGDAKAMRLLAANPEIDDESVGFHAQQAIEKWIKAVMASHGLPEERTHDLGGLLEILAAAEIEAPPGSDWLDFLTVFAVPLRYEERLDFEALDRDSIVALVDVADGRPRQPGRHRGDPSCVLFNPEIGRWVRGLESCRTLGRSRPSVF